MKTYQKVLIGIGCALLVPFLIFAEVNRTSRGVEKSNVFVDITWPLYKKFGNYDLEMLVVAGDVRTIASATVNNDAKGVARNAELNRRWVDFFENKGYGYYMPKVREDLSQEIYGLSVDEVTRLTALINSKKALEELAAALIAATPKPLEDRFRTIGPEKRIAVSALDTSNGRKLEVAFSTKNGRYENIPGFFRADDLAWWENSENADGGYVLITKNDPPGLASNCPNQTDAVWLFVVSDTTQLPRIFACGEPAKVSSGESSYRIFAVNNKEGKHSYAIIIYRKSEKSGDAIYLNDKLDIVKRERLDDDVVEHIKKTFKEDAEIDLFLKSQG